MDSTMTDNITTTGELARYVTRVLEALAGYDHLPALNHIGVFASGGIYLSVNRYGHDAVRGVCVWAAAFNVPVVIDLSSSAGELYAVLPLADGIEARLDKYINHQDAYEYGAALGIPVSPGGQVQVEAAALLAALDQQNEVAA